jgi:hypothetical protein
VVGAPRDVRSLGRAWKCGHIGMLVREAVVGIGGFVIL